MKLYPIERTLGFTLKQGFLVKASDIEDAAEKVSAFVDSDWSDATATRLCLVQVSDSLQQIDNSQEINFGDGIMSADAAGVDSSMRTLGIQNQANAMFALLRRVAETPSMYHGNVSALGMEVKTFVDDLEAKLDGPRQLLEALIAAS